MKYLLSSLFLISSLFTQKSQADFYLPVMSSEQIEIQLQPRLLGNLRHLCAVDKKDNYFQFLQRIAFHYGKTTGLGNLQNVEKIASEVVKKYKLQNKPSCVDLALGLLEAGIIDGKKTSVKIDPANKDYRSVALRSIGGYVDLSGLRSWSTYQNENVEVSFLLSRMVRRIVSQAIINKSELINENDPKYILFYSLRPNQPAE